MATNMYIRFENPDIPGSSTAPGHDKEIEILSWSHGFVSPTSPTRSAAGSGTVEQASHQNLSFTKYLDSVSTVLQQYCWSGQQMGRATMRLFRSDGTAGAPVPYLTVAMQHVIIANYSISGGAGDLPVENVALDYGMIQYDYVDQKLAAPPR